MLFRRERYNDIEMTEIAQEASKTIFTKEKKNILRDLEILISKKIDEYLKNKLEMKLTNLNSINDNLERSYYYEKGKGILTEEKEREIRENMDEIKNKIDKIKDLKEILF